MIFRNILYGFILSFSSHSAKPYNFINFLRPAQKAAHHGPSRSEEETEEQVLEDGEEALDLGLGAEAGLLYNGTPVVTVISPQQLRTVPPAENKFIRRDGLAREPSVQSDVTSHGSHGSSVESYLESRKPDPEEVLLSLGFGGPVSSLDSEVTRIPKRFLQPSKVKGVAIKDFLRHQQELIENFETGFCGYRGLSGASGAMPSVIVAKIMEKLREHERDSVHSTGTSEYASLVTTPPPEVGRRFSHHSSLHHHHHHRHMLKRGSAPSSSSPSPSSRQNTSLSVLNADNRRFLESQGSKSPEVPRKRMIIGQRSFTFGRDGDLIELESPSASSREDSSLGPVPLPPLKPLVHKDSVLSSATDLSLTSVDSDSDTDERSGSYELHRRLRIPLPQSPLPVLDSGQIHSSTPYSENLSSSAKISSFPEFETEKLVGTPTHRPLGIGKRMSSTSLSSWESDANSSPLLVENSHGRAKFSVGDPEEHRHKSSHSLLGNLPIRYESIEEDVEMKTESDVSKESSFPLPSTSEDSKSNDGLVFNVQTECSNEETQENKQESDDCVFTLSQPSCPTSKVPISDEVTSAQGRRGSLKRQQNVAEEDALELISDSSPGCQKIECGSECNNDGNPKSEDVCLEKLSILCDNGCESTDPNRKFDNDPELLNSEHNCTESEDGLSDFEGIILPQLEIIDECLFKKDNVNSAEIHENGMGHLPLSDVDVHSCSGDTGLEVAEGNELVIASPHLQVSRDLRGDSFEMEEIGNGEDEAKIVTLTRARSDSSGFLDGDIERSENSESKAWEKHKTVENERSANVNSTLDVLADVNIEPRLRGGSTGTIVPDSENSVEKCDVGSFTKRLSLPVVCVIDESGGLLHSRSNSVHSESSDDTNSSGSGNVKKSHRRRTRRIHSAPEPLALTSSCSSVSNMFSSCSDESVIHIDLKAQCTPIQPTAEGIASTFRASKDLQELLEELAVRGVNLPQEFDSPSFSSQPSSQCAPLQADAVRAALNTYSSHLGESMSTLQANSELLECVVEARRELEIVRYIREQIASELRRVASLLEEQPGPRAAAITRQMTVLLREQTRLCRQLEALAQGYGSVDSSFTIDSIPRTFYAPSTVSTVPCCNSERLLGAVREENRRLERLVQGHSQELAEIRLLLKELVSKQN
ncbi:hypothetical protein R5R35_000390 [Gryllus longicercus]|uniref:ITPR-interacting domain-containing protein n=1 Tax=Gryllus longicercus TaxID=2509291 RepID=A0AAN9YXT4_9ORTH